MDYKVKIRVENIENDNVKQEIWADILNPTDGKVIKKLIWWRDNQGIFHDESSNLPTKYRKFVDKAWISAVKKL